MTKNRIKLERIIVDLKELAMECNDANDERELKELIYKLDQMHLY